jgi:hypothetical protein
VRFSILSFITTRRRLLASPRLRAGCVLVIVLTLTALAAGNPGWVGPVLAQTVPTITKSPTAGPPPVTPAATSLPATSTESGPAAAPSATPGPSATPRPTRAAPPSPTSPAGCAAAPRNLAAIHPGPRARLTLPAAGATLWATQRQVLAGAGALCWLTAASVPAASLPPAPAGWALVGRGIRLAALGPADQPLAAPARGLLAGFQLTTRQRAGTEVRVAALGLPAAPTGWTLLPTRGLGDQACAPVPALPATVMLVASAAP